MMRIALVSILMMLSNVAFAWSDLDRMMAATSLGNLLASEEFCVLTFNQDAVAAYIEKKVPADDIQFTSMLDMMTDGSRVQLEGMSASRKTAHCAQTRRVAKSFGFIH